MKKNHDVRSLARYLGMKIRVNKNTAYKNPVISGIYTLTGVCSDDPYCDVNIDNPSMYPLSDKEVHAKDCFPILKTLDQLTKKDQKKFFWERFTLLDQEEMDGLEIDPDFTVYCDGTSERDECVLDPYWANVLLSVSGGAVPDKDSPTGYVSVHDDLPCIKWEEEKT